VAQTSEESFLSDGKKGESEDFLEKTGGTLEAQENKTERGRGDRVGLKWGKNADFLWGKKSP